MLGKLFKYEFKNTAKVMLAIYGVLVFTTLLVSIGSSMKAMQGVNLTDVPPVVELFFAASVLMYVLSIFALFTVSYVYLCIHFYKTMYSDQGYLTHTLPVKPVTLFNVKLVTSLVWMILTAVLFALSIFAFLIGASRGEIFSSEVAGRMAEIIKYEFVPIFGMTFGQFLLFIVLSFIISCLSYLLMIFASISIGQLFTGHKIAGSFATGIIIYMVQQVIATIVILVTGFSTFLDYEKIVTFADVLFSPAMIISMVISVLFAVALYIICIVMQTRHLNLD